MGKNSGGGPYYYFVHIFSLPLYIYLAQLRSHLPDMDLRPLLLSLIKVQYTRLYFKTIHIIPGEAFVAELYKFEESNRFPGAMIQWRNSKHLIAGNCFFNINVPTSWKRTQN